jgi:hypothetical protein
MFFLIFLRLSGFLGFALARHWGLAAELLRSRLHLAALPEESGEERGETREV